MDDRERMQLIEDDPQQGMTQLLSEYGGLLWAVARGKLRSPYFGDGDVEDCIADALGAFYAARDGYDPEKSSLRTYLTLLVRRRCADLLRMRSRRGTTLSLDCEEGASLVPSRPSPEEEVEARAECKRVLCAIDGLGEPDRTILLGKYYFGHSTKDLARALSMTPSAVDTKAHRARKRLRALLKGEDE